MNETNEVTRRSLRDNARLRTLERARREARSALQPSAATHQREICTYLALKHPRLWLVTFHVADAVSGALHLGRDEDVLLLCSMGAKLGVPDLLCLAPRNGFSCLALGLTRRGEQAEKQQARLFDEIRAAGGQAVQVDSFLAAKVAIDEYAGAGYATE